MVQLDNEDDALARDLLNIIDECKPLVNVLSQTELMAQLTMYVVQRDHKIYDEGFKKGQSTQKELCSVKHK